MADYTKLKAAIQQVIKQNGNNEITGDLLQQTLLSMVNTLGEGWIYRGIATPQTIPPITDGNVFYIASQPGIYSGFSSKEVKKGTIGIFTNMDASWNLASIDLSNLGVQMAEDAALQTEDKTIVGAINEVNKITQDAVLKTEQLLTPEEQTQVQSNIGVKDTMDAVGVGKIRIIDVEAEKQGDGFRNKNGIIESSTVYFFTKPIKVNQGDVLLLNNTFATTNVIPIAKVSSDNDFIRTISAGITGVHNYYAVAQSGYISLSIATAYVKQIQMLILPCKLANALAEPAKGFLANLYKAGGAVYNEERDTWLLNGIELTNGEMSEVYRYTSNFGCSQLSISAYAYTKIKTNFIKVFSHNWRSDVAILKNDCFFKTSFEVINLNFNSINTGCSLLEGSGVFGESKQLHTILGIIADGRNKNETTTEKYFTFYGCNALKDFKLYGLKVSTPLKDSPLITYATIKYLIDNAANTSAIIITFHPTTYSYITGTTEPTEEVGGTKDEWMALVAAAQEKRISLAQAE